MDTIRKVISDVVHDLKALSVDDRFSNRHIYSKLTDKLKTLFKQDADSRRLLTISEIWKRIPCVPLCEADMIECCVDLPSCRRLMKSRFAIPEVFQTSYGNILKVMNLDASREFKQTTFPAYKDIVQREYKNPNVTYFILLEGYIYVPDSEVEEVQSFGLFKNPFEVTRIVNPEAHCLKPLDEPFPCPDYLLDIIKTAVVKELAGISLRIPQDERANLNSNEK